MPPPQGPPSWAPQGWLCPGDRVTITLGHDKPRGQEGGPFPTVTPCPEQGRAQGAGAEGLRVEWGTQRGRAVVATAPQDVPGPHPRRYPSPGWVGLEFYWFSKFCH